MAHKTSEGHFLSRILGSLAGGAVFMGTQGMSWTESISLCVLFSAFAFVARHFEDRRSQEQRDEEARKVEREKSRNFVLYLRPFHLTNAVPLANPDYVAGAAVTSAGYEPRSLDFEALMQNVASEECPVIGFGYPGEAIGVGRVSVGDAEWQESFVDLSERARAVLIVPGNRPGILWELQSLGARHLLGKCLFALPGRLAEHAGWDWAATKEALASAIPTLPEQLDDITTFRLDADGKIRDVQSASSGLVAHLSARLELIVRGEEAPKSRPARQRPLVLRVVVIAAAILVVGWYLLSPSSDSVMTGIPGPAPDAKSPLQEVLSEIYRGGPVQVDIEGCALRFTGPSGFVRASDREMSQWQGLAQAGTTAQVVFTSGRGLEQLGLQVRSVDSANDRSRVRRQIRDDSLCSDLAWTKVYSGQGFIVCEHNESALGMHAALAAFEVDNTPLFVDGAGATSRSTQVQEAMATLMTAISDAGRACGSSAPPGK